MFRSTLDWLWEHLQHFGINEILSKIGSDIVKWVLSGAFVFFGGKWLLEALRDWLISWRVGVFSGDRLGILIARLANDPKGVQSDHIRMSLQRHFSIAGPNRHIDLAPYPQVLKLPWGNYDRGFQRVKAKARRWLRKKRGHLLIWGKVVGEHQGKDVLELNFVTRDGEDSSTDPLRFILTDRLTLPESFSVDFTAVLVGSIASQVLPTQDTSRYVADVLEPVIKQLVPIVDNPPPALAELPLQRAQLFSTFARANTTVGIQQGQSAALEQAISAYRVALLDWQAANQPLQWALTQSNLGSALVALAQNRADSRILEEAVVAFEQATEVYKDAAPLLWAMCKANLGGARRELQTFEKSVEDYNAALTQFTPGRAPFERAITQNNLGLSLKLIGQRDGKLKPLEDAVQQHKNALQFFERTRERFPLHWATTQMYLGDALRTVGGELRKAPSQQAAAIAKYQAARSCIDKALSEFSRKQTTDWADAQFNLGLLLCELGETQGDAQPVSMALRCHVAAFDFYFARQMREYARRAAVAAMGDVKALIELDAALWRKCRNEHERTLEQMRQYLEYLA